MFLERVGSLDAPLHLLLLVMSLSPVHKPDVYKNGYRYEKRHCVIVLSYYHFYDEEEVKGEIHYIFYFFFIRMRTRKRPYHKMARLLTRNRKRAIPQTSLQAKTVIPLQPARYCDVKNQYVLILFQTMNETFLVIPFFTINNLIHMFLV